MPDQLFRYGDIGMATGGNAAGKIGYSFFSVALPFERRGAGRKEGGNQSVKKKTFFTISFGRVAR